MMTQIMGWLGCILFLVLEYFARFCHPLDSYDVTKWTARTNETFTSVGVTSHQGAVAGRSKVDCVRICTKFSHCHSFVFDKVFGFCYLNPDTWPVLADGGTGRLYTKKDTICNKFKSPSITNAVTITWHETLTSLHGNVTCLNDFISSPDDVTVTCTATGQWETNGECVRRVWTNPPVGVFDIPQPLVEGWSVCIAGIPTQRTRFTIDLKPPNTTDIVLHTDVRFNYSIHQNAVVMSSYINGTYVDAVFITDNFPFTFDQPFHLAIRLAGEDRFEVYVNGVSYRNHSQTVPASLITNVLVRNDVNLTLMDVWCDQ